MEKYGGAIRRVENFDELFEIVKKGNGIVGLNGTKYSSKYLVYATTEIRRRFKILLDRGATIETLDRDVYWQDTLLMVTRSEGFRDKVWELLRKEIENKKEEGENK